MPSPDDVTAFAAHVPVYVRASADAFELVDTASDAVLSTHATLREALDETLDSIPIKRPVLYDQSGQPNGEWRWFPAAAEEETANEIDGIRMSRTNIWQMAEGLNARVQPVPIDGGPQPEGMRESEVHGTAIDSATPANGWAHVGVVVIDGNGWTTLMLRGEVLPEIAPEIDRGRLAFGSAHFTHSEPDANGEVDHIRLESFALTNRPVDQRIQAASSVRSARARKVATRSRLLSFGMSAVRSPARRPARGHEDARLVAQRSAIDAAERQIRAELAAMGKRAPANIRVVAMERALRHRPDVFRRGGS